MSDCIHGFEAGLCDICFPRQAPPPRETRPQPKRAAGAPRSRRMPSTAPAGRPAALPPFVTRRLYHFTHVRNLDSILVDGGLRAAADGASPDVDVTAPMVRRLREHADIGDGRTVAQFVPLALTPDSLRWIELRSGAAEAHWSAAARQSDSRDYLMLQIEARRVGDDVVVADGDAASPLTAFALGEPARAVARAVRMDAALASPEVLAPQRVPVEAIVLVGVANEPMRQRVRDVFGEAEVRPPRIVVHTPWFTG